LTDKEGFREIFGDPAVFRVEPRPNPRLGSYAFLGLYQLESWDAPPPLDDELIIGEEFVTYLLYEPNCDMTTLSVSAHEGYLEVTVGATTVRKEIGFRVDCERADFESSGGIVSIKLRRISSRDGDP
jgi:hypothetical protein